MRRRLSNVAEAIPQGHPARQADHHHETRDVKLWVLLTAAFSLLAVALFLHTTIWWLMNGLNNLPAKAPAPLSPLAALPQVPPEPRVQVSPSADLAQFRAAQQRAANGYGWVDPNAGRVHVPVEQAKELFLAQPQVLPAQPQTQTPPIPAPLQGETGSASGLRPSTPQNPAPGVNPRGSTP
jgi:hypothetical protein